MSHALNGSSAIRRLKHSKAIEIRDGITFDYYTGLPHMCSVLFLPVYSLFKCFRSSHACHMRPVLFLPVQSLLTCFRSSLTRFADFVSLFLTNNSSDSKAFLHFSGSPTAVHSAFLFFDVKAWPQSQTDLFTCTTVLHWAYLSQTHRPILLHCMHYGITLWAYLSEPLVKDSHKRLSSTEKPQYHVLQVT